MADEPRRELRFSVGAVEPSIFDTISIDGAAQDLTGLSVTFKMRPAMSDVLKVNAAATVLNQTTSKGGVSYSWATGDVDTSGTFYGWWVVNRGGGRMQETDEFPITFDEHAPGYPARVGDISEYLRSYIPATYQALTRSPAYGQDLIQRQIDLAKYSLFATVCLPVAEATYYSPPVRDYVAKVSAIRIIPGAIDYWGDQTVQVTTSGTNESASYPERREQLWKLRDRLRRQILGAQLFWNGTAWVLSSRPGNSGAPVVSHRSINKITPDPVSFGALYASNAALSWSSW